MSSGKPGSTTLLTPLLMLSTFAWLISIPRTSWPPAARQAAETEPTYPSPKTLIFMCVPSNGERVCGQLVTEFSHLEIELIQDRTEKLGKQSSVRNQRGPMCAPAPKVKLRARKPTNFPRRS